MTRKRFERLTEDVRRTALLEATLAVVSEDGIPGASVRRIALKAGVSAGLIRHYFDTKDDMVRAAYSYLMAGLTARAAQMAEQAKDKPEAALANFVRANLTEPNISEHAVTLWATFIGLNKSTAGYSDVHREAYREFLEILEALIFPVLRANDLADDPITCRELAIAMNGILDGLWLEGSLGHGLYNSDDLPRIALQACEGILRLPDGTLTQHQTPE